MRAVVFELSFSCYCLRVGVSRFCFFYRVSWITSRITGPAVMTVHWKPARPPAPVDAIVRRFGALSSSSKEGTMAGCPLEEEILTCY